jgi:hypothetical protein
MTVEAAPGIWGPLAHPLRTDAPTAEAGPWKDNAYLAFWDPQQDVYGAVHVSTSPNPQGTLARASVSVRGRTAEVIEPLEPGTFTSRSISFDLDGRITVEAPGLRANLSLAPQFALGDYRTTDLIPELVNGAPLQHVERFAHVTGTVNVGGECAEIQGIGGRDRSWGYRDESVSWPEYIGVLLAFPDYGITTIRMADSSGGDRTAGFWLGDDARPVTAITPITRDASGLFAAAQLTFAGGEQLQLRRTTRKAGFWVPMGWERTGPTMSAYDEFIEVRTDHGESGFGIVEQGIVRQLI